MSFDASKQLVLAWDKKSGAFEDKTRDIVSLKEVAGKYSVRYRNTRYPFPYNPQNLLIVEPSKVHDLTEDVLIEVNGEPWNNAIRIEQFDTAAGPWTRVHYSTQQGPASRAYPSSQVRPVANARQAPRVEALMSYVSTVVAAHPADDPLHHAFKSLRFVHPDSALAAYLAGAPPAPINAAPELIVPFSSNLSQRDALHLALTHQISVIEGPPGTGKTQTILNLISNIVRDPNATVGVVSFNNAAVDNVYDKLVEQGYGFIAAPLGNQDRRAAFLDDQPRRNAGLAEFLQQPQQRRYDLASLSHYSATVHHVYDLERRAAQARSIVARIEREQSTFAAKFPLAEEGPVLPLAAASWTSATLLELIAEIELRAAHTTKLAAIRWRMRRRWRYRIPKATDETSMGFIVELQRQYLSTRLREVQSEVARCDSELASPAIAQIRPHVQALSGEILRDTLYLRYANRPGAVHTMESLWKDRGAFAQDYPVLLSTCHSLPNTVGAGRLLDYLIIDEASQVNLAIGMLAMSAARRVVVVGDTRQLPHIAQDIGGIGPPPGLRAYDYSQHNVLSSLMAVYGDSLPSTMLREHYRCDPRIIDFCNRKFYGGKLIPMRSEGPGQALGLVRTTPGQHSRALVDGGHINQREIDVLIGEALPHFCGDLEPGDIGVIAPFRKQADLLLESVPHLEADTVHKFQGREKAAIVMSTVIDASHAGTRLARFVDDAQLINVAVSRAQSLFVLVANPDMPEECQHLRDLIAFIEQRAPDRVLDSDIVSVFDVLYTDYAKVLASLANRITGAADFKSEEAAWLTIRDLMEVDEFQHLQLHYQVYLNHVLSTDAMLTPDETSFVRNRASLDFVISSRVTDKVLGAIEVDGFMYHHDSPAQLRRDRMKDAILARNGIPLLRLATHGSGEQETVRTFLEALA